MLTIFFCPVVERDAALDQADAAQHRGSRLLKS
jgi:hypothetical protein